MGRGRSVEPRLIFSLTCNPAERIIRSLDVGKPRVGLGSRVSTPRFFEPRRSPMTKSNCWKRIYVVVLISTAAASGQNLATLANFNGTDGEQAAGALVQGADG